jgi:hypothetical protein
MTITRKKREREQRPPKDFKLAPEGVHKCTLTTKECKVDKWVKRGDKRVKSGEKRDGVMFTFKVEDIDDCYINRSEGDTTHKSGNLYQMMQMCHDSILREIEFDGDGYAIDEDLFYDTLNKVEGWKYNVTCKHNESGGVTYCNFVSCIPLKDEKVEIKKREEPKEEAPPDDDEDDIPF